MKSTLYLECSSDKTTEGISCERINKNPHHWSNIPSGAEYQNDFEQKYPGMKSGSGYSKYEKSFPYQRLRTAPQKPASNLLLYSNTNTYSQISVPKYDNSSLFLQNHSINASRGYHEHNRIQKALEHIENASKILENY